MTVYMDPPLKYGTNKKWCHLWADTLEELHATALKAGLYLKWFQSPSRGNASWDHYDVCSDAIRRRLKAMGVVETDRYGAAYHVACLRWDGVMIARIENIRSRNAKADQITDFIPD